MVELNVREQVMNLCEDLHHPESVEERQSQPARLGVWLKGWNYQTGMRNAGAYAAG